MGTRGRSSGSPCPREGDAPARLLDLHQLTHDVVYPSSICERDASEAVEHPSPKRRWCTHVAHAVSPAAPLVRHGGGAFSLPEALSIATTEVTGGRPGHSDRPCRFCSVLRFLSWSTFDGDVATSAPFRRRHRPRRDCGPGGDQRTIGVMASPDRSAATPPVRALIYRTTVAVAVTGMVATGCQQDCITGDSLVELRVPSTSWRVDRFCVDDECLSASERQPRPVGPEAGAPVFYSYAVHVGDQPDTYSYRVEVAAPDGARHAHHGVIETEGNMMGGETCKPTSATASLIVHTDGQLTTQP